MKKLLLTCSVVIFLALGSGSALADKANAPTTMTREETRHMDGNLPPNQGGEEMPVTASSGASTNTDTTTETTGASTTSSENALGGNPGATTGAAGTTNSANSDDTANTSAASNAAVQNSITGGQTGNAHRLNSVGTAPSLPVTPTGSSIPTIGEDGATFENLLGTFIPRIINFLVGLTAIVTVFVVIWGGYLFFTALGDSAKVEEAIKTIQWGTTGLTIALLAYIIVQVVVNIRLIPGL